MGPAKVIASKHPLYKVKTITEKGESEFWTIRNKLKKAPSHAVWRDNHETQQDIQKPMDELEVTVSSSESDEEEYAILDDGNEGANDPVLGSREPYELRDRAVWNRNYAGMGVYIAMLET